MLDISFKVFPLKRTIPSTLFRVVPQMEYWCFQSSSFSRMVCCWKKICCFHCCRASWICPISMLAIIGADFRNWPGFPFHFLDFSPQTKLNREIDSKVLLWRSLHFCMFSGFPPKNVVYCVICCCFEIDEGNTLFLYKSCF